MDGGRSLATSEVPQTTIAAGQLLQHISRVAYRGTPLYFSRDGANRYDSPGMSYGVFYLGFDLPTALMESVFHKRTAGHGRELPAGEGEKATLPAGSLAKRAPQEAVHQRRRQFA